MTFLLWIQLKDFSIVLQRYAYVKRDVPTFHASSDLSRCLNVSTQQWIAVYAVINLFANHYKYFLKHVHYTVA